MIAKGGDFNITDKQFVPILFDNFTKTKEKDSDQMVNQQCKSQLDNWKKYIQAN